MDRKRTELALRPKRTPERSPSKIVFTHTDHAPQYALDATTLGEFAIQWTTESFTGVFSVTDLPGEWVAFIQTAIRGGWYESSYAGPAPFSSVRWDVMPWDDRVSEWIFSPVRMEAAAAEEGALEDLMHSLHDVDVEVWGNAQKAIDVSRDTGTA